MSMQSSYQLMQNKIKMLANANIAINAAWEKNAIETRNSPESEPNKHLKDL